MDPEQQLKKLDLALGKLAPKGTWLCEVLENIWRSDSQQDADKIADDARNVFREIGIETALWCGNRGENDPVDLTGDHCGQKNNNDATAG